jgi:hypothetical protein
MLLWNPFALHYNSAHRHPAKLAGVERPLLAASIAGKKFLQINAEQAVTRLYGYWHHSPIQSV